MKQILTIITAALSLVGCTLSESTRTDITPMPTLRVGYNVADVSHVRAYVFDEQGLFMQSVQKDIDQTSEPSKVGQDIISIDLLKGVAQRSYTVVSYANCSMMDFAQMTIGQSRIEDLTLQFAQSNHSEQFPELRYSKEVFQVSRTSEIKTNTPSLGFMHHQIELVVTGIETADVPISTYRAELSGLPLAYDHQGSGTLNEGIYIPQFSLFGEDIKDSFRVFRLSPSGFRIRFWEGDRSLVDVHITPGAEALAKDTLQIRVVILSAQIILSVGDWVHVINNTPGIGG